MNQFLTELLVHERLATIILQAIFSLFDALQAWLDAQGFIPPRQESYPPPPTPRLPTSHVKPADLPLHVYHLLTTVPLSTQAEAA